MSIFGSFKRIESQIDAYLDDIDQAALHFKEAIEDYLNANHEKLQKRIDEISLLEHDADKKRRDIRYQLYTEMLIPESRGDVLGLLETSDNVLDIMKHTVTQLCIERPEIPDFLKQDFIDLAQASTDAVSSLVKADLAYFRDTKMVNNYINKVTFYEREADTCEIEIYRKIFQSEKITDLGHKNHLKYFAAAIANVSDEAQEVSERLSVSVIKREI